MTSSRLLQRFESIVGADHVGVAGAAKGRHAPALVARPGAHAEVVECLRACSEANAVVVPAGMMSWLDAAGASRPADVVISLARMNRVVEYAPADLIATLEAGASIGGLNEITAANRQWLPLDPPGSPDASLGAIVACASSGALRFGFGTPRDYVIGLRLAHIDGTESKCGGKVVKNVAGYDMNKLYVGSFGTLAILTEITFKLRPLPEQFATVAMTAKPHDLARAASELLASSVKPAALVLIKGFGSGPSREQENDTALLVRFIESETAVSYQVERTREIATLCGASIEKDDPEKNRLWIRVNDIHREAPIAIKIHVPMSRAAELFERVTIEIPGVAAAADLGVGIIRIAFESTTGRALEIAEQLRGRAAAAGGNLTVEQAPLEVLEQVARRADSSATARIMNDIKTSFDPQGLLNPAPVVFGF